MSIFDEKATALRFNKGTSHHDKNMKTQNWALWNAWGENNKINVTISYTNKILTYKM